MDVDPTIVEPQSSFRKWRLRGAYMMNVCIASFAHICAPYGGGAIKEAGMKVPLLLNPHTPDFPVGRYSAGFGYGIALAWQIRQVEQKVYGSPSDR